jgi:hypothetical protein
MIAMSVIDRLGRKTPAGRFGRDRRVPGWSVDHLLTKPAPEPSGLAGQLHRIFSFSGAVICLPVEVFQFC